MIEIRTLGPPEVLVDGEQPPRDLLWRKNLALLIYIACSPLRRRSREQLAGTFWGDKLETSARHSLNEALRILRRSGGEGLLAGEGDQIVMSGDAVRLDLDRFEALATDGDAAGAADLVRGPFLEGFGVADSPEFEDWLAAERRRWLGRSVEALIRSAELRLDAGDVSAARLAAERACALDPVADAPVRLSMRCAALLGERGTALERFGSHRSVLEREIGIEPEEETLALACRIRDRKDWKRPESESAEDRRGRRPELVGRESELASAVAVLRDYTLRGAAAAIVVRGPAGAGKTRFCEEICSRASLEGVIVATTRSVPDDLASEGAGVRAFLGSSEAILEAVAREPLLLWADSTEYLDAGSLATLVGLLRDAAEQPLLVVISAASQPPRVEIDELASRLGRDVPGVSVELQPLNPDQLSALAQQVLPDWEADAIERLIRRLDRDSGGLPLIAVEILNALRLGLELSPTETVWPEPSRTFDHTLPGKLPDSLVAAIRIGYRRLSTDAQTVLGCMSVMEDRAMVADIQRGTGLPTEELLAALDELEWHRWLQAEPRGYSFVARLNHEVVAADMLTEGQRLRIRERLQAEPPPA